MNIMLIAGISSQSSEREALDNFRENMGDALGMPLKFDDVASSPEDIMKLLSGS